jgi:hypothetical protein
MAKGTANVINNGGKLTAGIVVTSSRGGHIDFKSYPLIKPKKVLELLEVNRRWMGAEAKPFKVAN